MLSAVRSKASSWAMGAILFLALLAMVVTGFGTGGFGGLDSLGGQASRQTLARVDGRTLTEDEYTDIFNREFSQARQQQPTLTMAEFMEQAFDPILDQLVLALAVQAYGQQQGLVVSQRMIDREILNIPAFRNFAGQFDEATFRQALAGQNITEAQLRQDISRSLMQRQLLGPIARGVRVPETLARAYADLLLERRRGAIGIVPTERLRAGIAPSDAEVEAFYRERPGRFTIPERRVLRFAVIEPEQVQAAATPTDAEIEAYYRQNQANYGPRETRDVQQIVLPDQAAAQRFVQQVRSGTSFTAAAGEAGFSAEDISASGLSRDQLASTASAEVAEAAFGAAQGAVVGPVRSPLGFHVVRVEAINRVPGRELAAVRDEIVTAVTEQKLATALGDLIARVEERLSAGASIEEVARSERLNLQTTPPVTATGQVWGQRWTMPADLQPLLRSAFELDPEETEPVIEQIDANERFALLAVERVIPAAPPPLAEIRDQVRNMLIQVRALERGRVLAHQIAERMNGGMGAAQAFAQAQPALPAPEAINMQRLDITRGGAQAPPPLITLFSIPEGSAHVLSAPDGAGWFVVYHAERTPGDASGQPQLIATTRSEFSSSAAEEIAQQFATSIQMATEVQRNPEAIQALRRRLSGTGQ